MSCPAASSAPSIRERCPQTGQAFGDERLTCAAGLRMNKAHVTHPELKCTFCLGIIGVKKNPNGQTYTSLGVMTKGTIIEVYAGSLRCRVSHCYSCWGTGGNTDTFFACDPQVNVSELGLVTPGGKVVWGKYAQVRSYDMPRPDAVLCALICWLNTVLSWASRATMTLFIMPWFAGDQ